MLCYLMQQMQYILPICLHSYLILLTVSEKYYFNSTVFFGGCSLCWYCIKLHFTKRCFLYFDIFVIITLTSNVNYFPQICVLESCILYAGKNLGFATANQLLFRPNESSLQFGFSEVKQDLAQTVADIFSEISIFRLQLFCKGKGDGR